MLKERELLRQQMELLAERAGQGYPDELEGLSKAMCGIYRELAVGFLHRALLFCSVLHLLVSIFVQVKKLLRRDA